MIAKTYSFSEVIGAAREVTRGTFATTNPWRFSSEYAEDETATVYYDYRHYEPVSSGRWLQRDPIGEEGGCCFDINEMDIGEAKRPDFVIHLPEDGREPIVSGFSAEGCKTKDVLKLIEAM